MSHFRNTLITFAIASSLGLAACSSGQQSTGKEAATANPTSQPAAAQQQYQATLSMSGDPTVSADSKDVAVTVTVTNTGSAPFGTDMSPGVNVNLGAHGVDTNGKVVDQDLARGTLPHIAPGGSASATILLPIDKILGKSAELLPVQENVGWFDKWGTKPLKVGPFVACSDAATGKICDSDGKPLPIAAQ